MTDFTGLDLVGKRQASQQPLVSGRTERMRSSLTRGACQRTSTMNIILLITGKSCAGKWKGSTSTSHTPFLKRCCFPLPLGRLLSHRQLNLILRKASFLADTALHWKKATSSHSLKQTEEIRGLHVKLTKPLEKQAAFIMHITVSDQCHRKLESSFRRPVFNVTGEKGVWCWTNRVKVVSKRTPQSHENPSKVSNLMCKLQESHTTAGLYLMFPPLCCHHFMAASAFGKDGACGHSAPLSSLRLSARPASLVPPVLLLVKRGR